MAGGLELAAWCDLRVCGEGARFGCLERRWGVPLIDGGTYRLPRIVGLGRALDLILTGREFDVAEAYDIGFANRVVPDGDSARRRRRPGRADRRAPVELPSSTTGRRVYEGLGLELDDGLANEDRHGRDVIFAPGFADGVARFERAAAMSDGPSPNRDRLRRLRRTGLPPHPPAARTAAGSRATS